MKNLIIDPFAHYPTAYKMFADADYYCEDKGEPCPGGVDRQMHRHIALSRKDVQDTYGFSPVELTKLEKKYEKIIIVFPLNYLNDPGTGKYDPLFNDAPENEAEVIQSYFLFLKDLVSKVSYNKLILLDGNDRAVLFNGETWLVENEFPYDLILKREYRSTYIATYPQECVPFPFQTFGNKNPTWRFFEEKKKGSERVAGCFWSGGPIYHFPPGKRDEWCNRRDTLVAIQDYLVIENGIPQEEFLDRFNKYKCFLHLNGTGHMCSRFFEGLSRDSLMIMEKMDVVFPFEFDAKNYDGDFFHPSTVFEYPLEFVEKLTMILSDEKLYDECLDHQNALIEKYYNYEWINNYVNRNLSRLEAKPKNER